MAKLTARGHKALCKFTSPRILLKDRSGDKLQDNYAIRSDGWILRRTTYYWANDPNPSRQGWKLWKRIKKAKLQEYIERTLKKFGALEGWKAVRCN